MFSCIVVLNNVVCCVYSAPYVQSLYSPKLCCMGWLNLGGIGFFGFAKSEKERAIENKRLRS